MCWNLIVFAWVFLIKGPREKENRHKNDWTFRLSSQIVKQIKVVWSTDYVGIFLNQIIMNTLWYDETLYGDGPSVTLLVLLFQWRKVNLNISFIIYDSIWHVDLKKKRFNHINFMKKKKQREGKWKERKGKEIKLKNWFEMKHLDSVKNNYSLSNSIILL